MSRIEKLMTVALLGGLAFGAYYSYSAEKAEEQAFETARQTALDAPDPFLELARFRSAIGDYGKSCSIFADAICKRRMEVENELVTAGVKKGSVPALIHLFDSGIKWPPISYTDLPDNESQRLGQRLISLAESAPVTKENAALFFEAAELLKYSTHTAKAIDLYVKAWQTGAPWAASELAYIYDEILNDKTRAYFWYVRARNVPVGTESFKSLSAEEKLTLQSKAHDTNLVNI
ncbi:hypothetical protein [Candidatus Pantoea deserta]|nr:hypothetical protein [Pantoea deserta]